METLLCEDKCLQRQQGRERARGRRRQHMSSLSDTIQYIYICTHGAMHVVFAGMRTFSDIKLYMLILFYFILNHVIVIVPVQYATSYLYDMI